jgi:hypothetical protein
MNYLKNSIKGCKDSAISSAMKILAEKYVSGFARINTIEIDSSNRSLMAEVLLKGETEPIILTVVRYEIITKGEKRLFVPHAVSSSRQWIDTLAKEYLQGRAFEIPAPLAKTLTFLA